MSDALIDGGDELMSRATDFPPSDSAPATVAPPATGSNRKVCCPYCGAIMSADAAGQPCPRCTMEDTPATRAATKSRIGPWYVLQARNPAAPGMKWITLLSLVEKGQVTARSIVRGPTTHQLWRFAAHVKGLSREFGLCFSCGGRIEKSEHVCPHCDRVQELPGNPDVLLETREPMIGQTVQREIKAPPPAIATPPKPIAMDITLTPRGEIGHPPENEPRTEWHPD